MRRAGYILIFAFLLLRCAGIHGQARMIGKDFIQYSADLPWEDTYLHTDRNRYIAGENIWFKVYLFDRRSLKPSTLSKIAYVELLNYDNRPVIRKRIYLENGSGPGQFTLPDTLSSGAYTIRAYTSWMKNFLPAGCFLKEVDVYNAINLKSSFRKPLTAPDNHSAGNASYTNSGLMLEVNNLKPDFLELTFRTTSEFRRNNSSLCNLFIHTRGNVNLTETIALTGDETTRVIPGHFILPGINHITIFDSRGLPVSERFIYTPMRNAARTKLTVQSVYGRRQKIPVGVITSYDSMKLADLSVSITPATDNSVSDLEDYLLYGTEFGNNISKQLNGRRFSSLSAGEADSMLMNVRSNWIDWDKILGKERVVIKYLPEQNEHFLTGNLVNSGGAGEYVLMSIPGKKANFRYATTDGSGDFSFGIPIDEDMKEIILQPDDIKQGNVVNISSSFYEEYPPSGHFSDTAGVPGYMSEWSVNYQVQKIYGTAVSERAPQALFPPEIRRFYGKPDIQLVLDDYIKLPVMEEIFFELLPGTYLRKRRTGYEINVTDPVTNLAYEYPTMVFVDGVPIDDADQIASLDPEFVEQIDVVRERYLVGDYLFHGIVNIITKTGDFSAVTLPEYATRTFYRVIDPVERFLAPEYSAAEGKQNRIPDFRNTLWWSPSVRIQNGDSASFEFWSSDISGDYIIRVNGIASDGSPVSSEKIIRIE